MMGVDGDRGARAGTMRRLTWALGGTAAVGAAGLGAAARRRRTREELNGSVALVTGASAGLGLAVARELADRGCALVICGRDPAALGGAADELRDAGATVLARPVDVTDRQATDELVAAALARFGRVDVLVNNAGVIDIGEVGGGEHEAFAAALDVMFWGAVNPTLAVLPSMRQRGDGRITTITSIGGRLSPPHLVPYACAKHAAFAFSQGLRAELADDGITATTVVPGLMRTGSHRAARIRRRRPAEFAWFAVAGANALTATSPHRAARKIVEATRDRDALTTIGADAWLGTRVEGLAPRATSRLLGVVDRVLPDTGGEAEERAEGWELETAVSRSVLTAPGRRAGRDLQRHRAHVPDDGGDPAGAPDP